MKRGAIVVFESTVYPGATEEVCIPVLEKHTGMKWKQGQLGDDQIVKRLAPGGCIVDVKALFRVEAFGTTPVWKL